MILNYIKINHITKYTNNWCPMAINLLYQDLVHNICFHLNPKEVRALKDTCQHLYYIVNLFEDELQVKYLYSLKNNHQRDKNLKILFEGREWIKNNNPGWHGNFIFRWYCKYGYTKEVMGMLKDERVDPTDDGDIALCLAAKRSQYQVVKILLTDGRADPRTPIYNNQKVRKFLFEKGDVEMIKILILDERIELSAQYNILIVCACLYGLLEIVNILLEDPKVDPSAERNKPIILAARKCHGKIVERLLKDKRVDPAVDGNKIIRRAANCHYLSIVEMLLKDKRVVQTLNIDTIMEFQRMIYHRYHI